MAVTLQTIADRVGISRSAVSQILNRRENDFSSQATREKVFSVARELGYRQKFGHKLLRGDKTGTICILLASEGQSREEHIQELTLQLLRETAERGYTCYMENCSGNAENLDMIKKQIERGTDCFIATGELPKEVTEAIRHAGRNGIGFGTPLLKRGICHNLAPACAKIFHHFLAQGKTNCRLISNTHNTMRMEGLKLAFPHLSQREVLEKHFFPFPQKYKTNNIDDLSEIGYQVTEKLLDRDPHIQAIFYHSDYFVLGGIKCLCDHGIMPGEDVLLAGINNIYAIRHNIFPVSSIDHNIKENVRIIMAHLDDEEAFTEVIVPEPVIRTELPTFARR